MSTWRAAGGVAPSRSECYTRRVPTSKPRYAITDTGDVAQMLDLARERWPEETDRKALLLRLAEAGGDAVRRELDASLHDRLGQRQAAAFEAVSGLVDASILLDDEAWR